VLIGDESADERHVINSAVPTGRNAHANLAKLR